MGIQRQLKMYDKNHQSKVTYREAGFSLRHVCPTSSEEDGGHGHILAEYYLDPCLTIQKLQVLMANTFLLLGKCCYGTHQRALLGLFNPLPPRSTKLGICRSDTVSYNLYELGNQPKKVPDSLPTILIQGPGLDKSACYRGVFSYWTPLLSKLIFVCLFKYL